MGSKDGVSFLLSPLSSGVGPRPILGAVVQLTDISTILDLGRFLRALRGLA